jgi:hypothetical protein
MSHAPLNNCENEMPESIDRSGVWRFIFWLSCVLANLALAFSWLLAQTPGRLDRATFLVHLISRSFAVALLLNSIVIASRLWKSKRPIFDGRSENLDMQLVLSILCFELAISVYAVAGLMIARWFVRW